MKLFDCFMYFDEELVLDLRFNVLNDFVDKFVIAEATKDHSGKDKKLNFNIDNFPKFKDKIKYADRLSKVRKQLNQDDCI